MPVYNPNARGTYVKSNSTTGYFTCQVDIPNSWVPVGKTPAFDNGSLQGNVLTFTSTNIDFPSLEPASPAFTTFNFPNLATSPSSVTAKVTVVVQGKNTTAGLKKTGTVTNTPPNPT
jgi:hypothetical protein